MKEQLILDLLSMQLQFRLLHWQTMGDAKHRLYGDVYDSLGGMIDSFVEIMMGKNGRPEFVEEASISFKDISTINMQTFLDDIVEFLVGMSDMLDDRYDTDLLNLRDEMLALINKTKYLLTLKY